MGSPLIPYVFDPPADHFETDHLLYESVADGERVSWPLVGASLMVPKKEGVRFWFSLTDIEKANPQTFRLHGLSGFSLGQYHEFLLKMPNETQVSFKMGAVEASFGQATPLAAMIFHPVHRSKYFGTWEETFSLRLFGVDLEYAETAFINACYAYEAKLGVMPVLFELDEDKLFWPDPDESALAIEGKIFNGPPIILNVEPLRFFYNGLSHADHTAACISFYRVLEYFSFFTNASEVRKLRHDPHVSDADFSRRILDLVSRDEKGPLFKLIASLVDPQMLSAAQSEGLTSNLNVNTFCEVLYSFRNSIVHGKYSYGFALRSGSVLQEDPQLSSWAKLLRDLARRAIERYGLRA